MSDLRANTLSDLAGTGPATLTKQSAAKAWVHGDPDASVRDSFNVSSSTDIDVGKYQYDYTNALTDTDYAATASTRVGSAGSRVAHIQATNAASLLVNTTRAATSAYEDREHLAIVHGDLA